MNLKLIITLTTSYLLTSYIFIEFYNLYIDKVKIYNEIFPEQIDSTPVYIFITSVYICIFIITKYFAKNETYRVGNILLESIVIPLVSYCFGVTITLLIAGWSMFFLIAIGLIISLIIGIALFILNYTIISILKIMKQL